MSRFREGVETWDYLSWVEASASSPTVGGPWGGGGLGNMLRDDPGWRGGATGARFWRQTTQAEAKCTEKALARQLAGCDPM